MSNLFNPLNLNPNEEEEKLREFQDRMLGRQQMTTPGLTVPLQNAVAPVSSPNLPTPQAMVPTGPDRRPLPGNTPPPMTGNVAPLDLSPGNVNLPSPTNVGLNVAAQKQLGFPQGTPVSPAARQALAQAFAQGPFGPSLGSIKTGLANQRSDQAAAIQKAGITGIVTPEGEQEIGTLEEQKQAILGKQADIANRTSQELSDLNEEKNMILNTQSDLIREEGLRQTAMKVQRDSIINQEMGQIAALDAQIANQKIEPDRLFGGGSKVVANITTGILGALYGLGSALARKGNPGDVFNMIQSAVNRDIALQKDKMNQKKEERAKRMNMLGYYRQKYQDDVAADLAVKSHQYRIISNELAKVQNNVEDVQTRNRLDGYIERLNAASVESQQNLKNRLEDKLLQIQGQQLQAAGLDIERSKAAAAGQRGAKQLTETTLKEFADLEATNKQIDKLQDDFNKNTGIFSLTMQMVPGTPSNIYRTKRNALVGKVTKSLFGGNASEQDRAMINGLVPQAPTPDWKADDLFQSLRRLTAGKHTEMLRDLGSSGYDVSGIRPLNFAIQEEETKKNEDFAKSLGATPGSGPSNWHVR